MHMIGKRILHTHMQIYLMNGGVSFVTMMIAPTLSDTEGCSRGMMWL